jgi:hypothetical protein
MHKKIIIIAAVFISLHSKGQVTMSVQLPPAGMIQKDQLWNLVLVNNGPEIQETIVSLNLMDAVTGQTVLSAGTRSFVFGKGVKAINFQDIQPVQYNYIAADWVANYIPMGAYTACYRVSRNTDKGIEPLADDCVRLNINPLSPPLLNTPADRSLIESVYPQFTWLPPVPGEMFNNLNYDIIVAEVLPGQTPVQAVSNNVPVYANGNIKNPFENYPSGFSSMLPGKQYAWQVTARNGMNYSAQTEVWSFNVKSDSVQATASFTGYIVLKSSEESTGLSYIKEGELLVKYYSFDKDHETVVRLRSEDGKLVQRIDQKIAYGNNFMRFKLGNEFKKNAVYVIEMTDQRNIVYSIKFSIL